VGWEDFSMRTGEFKVFEGTIETNSKDDLSNAVFTFKVDASSVDVIAERLAGHVKSDRFLDVENYPEITFSAKGAEQISDSTYLAKGKLTIHGVGKQQNVNIRVKGHKETKRGYIFGLEVSLVVNRTDFGLDWGSPRLAENIKLVGHLLYKLKVEEE
jgi:polyisoprenoid-binding protein YceI